MHAPSTQERAAASLSQDQIPWYCTRSTTPTATSAGVGRLQLYKVSLAYGKQNMNAWDEQENRQSFEQSPQNGFSICALCRAPSILWTNSTFHLGGCSKPE